MVGTVDMVEVVNGEDIIKTMNLGNLGSMVLYVMRKMYMKDLHYPMKYKIRIKNHPHLECQQLQENLRNNNLQQQNWLLVKLFNTSTQIDIILFSDQDAEVFQLISLKKLISISILFLLLFKRELSLEVTLHLKLNNLTKLDYSIMIYQSCNNHLLKSAKWLFFLLKLKKKKKEDSRKDKGLSLKN